MTMDFEAFRRANGSIALEKAYLSAIERWPRSDAPRIHDGATFLANVEGIFPINSRQAAAIAIATAFHIASQP